MSKILIYLLVDRSIANIYIFPMLHFWKVFDTFIMFPGNFLTGHNVSILMPTSLMATS